MSWKVGSLLPRRRAPRPWCQERVRDSRWGGVRGLGHHRSSARGTDEGTMGCVPGLKGVSVGGRAGAPGRGWEPRGDVGKWLGHTMESWGRNPDGSSPQLPRPPSPPREAERRGQPEGSAAGPHVQPSPQGGAGWAQSRDVLHRPSPAAGPPRPGGQTRGAGSGLGRKNPPCPPCPPAPWTDVETAWRPGRRGGIGLRCGDSRPSGPPLRS